VAWYARSSHHHGKTSAYLHERHHGLRSLLVALDGRLLVRSLQLSHRDPRTWQLISVCRSLNASVMKYSVDSSTLSPRPNWKSRLDLLAYPSAILLACSMGATAFVTISCILKTNSDQGSGRTEHFDLHPDSGLKIAEMDGLENLGRGPGWMTERGPVLTRGPICFAIISSGWPRSGCRS
jgi:hypothetical protein